MIDITPSLRSDNDMTDDILQSVFLLGADLSVYLEPDTTGPLSQTNEAYRENYQLPFVISQKGKTFAFTSGDHLTTPAHSANLYRSYYAYSNISDAWIHFFPALKEGVQVANTTLMSLANYHLVEWIARNPKQPLFDSDKTDNDITLIHEAIREGARFIVSLQDTSGLWRRLPVDLAFYWEERACFQFQTAIHWYPEMFETPTAVAEGFAAMKFPDSSDANANAFQMQQSLAAACSYRSIFLDGTMQMLAGTAELKDQSWSRLIIFAS